MVAAGKFAVSLIRSWSEFEQHRDEWSNVWTADPRAEIFTHFDWLAAIAHAYGDGLVPSCPVISNSGKPVAILPVGVRDGSLNFLSSPRGDFNDLIFAANADSARIADDLDEVCRLAFSSLDDQALTWQNACLENVVEDSWLLKALSSSDTAASTGFPCRPLIAQHGVGPAARLTEETPEALKKKLCRKKTTKRRRNQLARLGNLEFVGKLDQTDLPQATELFVKLHCERRLAAGDESFLEDENGKRFLEAILQGPAQHSAKLSALRLDGQDIALCLGLEADGRYSYYAPTFDAEWSKYAAGDVLLSFMLEDAIDRGVEVFDFGLGDEAYKARFASETREVFKIHLFGFGVKPRLKRAALSLRETAKQNPRLYGAMKKVLNRSS
jgi:CelD/BcsL family acetyltransferase involved in cellulose biosynthesis